MADTPPCLCGKIVPRRKRSGSGKTRLAHKCPHGYPCPRGHKNYSVFSTNVPHCFACESALRERRGEGPTRCFKQERGKRCSHPDHPDPVGA